MRKLWIARDKDGECFIYFHYPFKEGDIWKCDHEEFLYVEEWQAMVFTGGITISFEDSSPLTISITTL